MAVPYHERQVGRLCAVHATNGLLGNQVYQAKDFDAIEKELGIPREGPRTLLQKACNFIEVCFRCKTPNNVQGNYDANVLMVALLKEGVTMKFWDARNKNSTALLTALKSPDCIGCVVNVQGFFSNFFGLCFGENGHWVAVKKVCAASGTVFFNLNSNLRAPSPFNEDKVFEIFILRHLKREAHVLIATKTSGGSTETRE